MNVEKIIVMELVKHDKIDLLREKLFYRAKRSDKYRIARIKLFKNHSYISNGFTTMQGISILSLEACTTGIKPVKKQLDTTSSSRKA